MDESEEPEIGPWTGLPLDLPPGQHPFDWYLSAMTRILGVEKTARYLGFFVLPPGSGTGADERTHQ